jgi:hypothetical protein
MKEDNTTEDNTNTIKDKDEPILACPHCQEYVIIEKLNCGIFRHGIYKRNGKQIPPHSSKEICDNLIKTNTIYGCGKHQNILNIFL